MVFIFPEASMIYFYLVDIMLIAFRFLERKMDTFISRSNPATDFFVSLACIQTLLL
jgi:hypothetical protein